MIEYGVALDKVTIINLPLLLESQLDSFPFLSHPILHCSIPLLFYYSSMVFPPLFLPLPPLFHSLFVFPGRTLFRQIAAEQPDLSIYCCWTTGIRVAICWR